MTKIPKIDDISTLSGSCNKITDGRNVHFFYKIETIAGERINISLALPNSYYYGRRRYGAKQNKDCELIVDEGNEFVNGFKRVRNNYGQYLYIKEEGNILLPYIFDVATDFNNLGFAMVGKCSEVAWINKNFQITEKRGKVYEDNSSMLYDFSGWQSISHFSEGLFQMSKCIDDDGRVAYLSGHDQLQIKVFEDCTGEIDEPLRYFSLASDKFDEQGHAFANKDSEPLILFDRGYYITEKRLAQKAIEDGILEKIRQEIFDNYKKTGIKSLKNKINN